MAMGASGHGCVGMTWSNSVGDWFLEVGGEADS